MDDFNYTNDPLNENNGLERKNTNDESFSVNTSNEDDASQAETKSQNEQPYFEQSSSVFSNQEFKIPQRPSKDSNIPQAKPSFPVNSTINGEQKSQNLFTDDGNYNKGHVGNFNNTEQMQVNTYSPDISNDENINIGQNNQTGASHTPTYVPYPQSQYYNKSQYHQQPYFSKQDNASNQNMPNRQPQFPQQPYPQSNQNQQPYYTQQQYFQQPVSTQQAQYQQPFYPNYQAAVPPYNYAFSNVPPIKTKMKKGTSIFLWSLLGLLIISLIVYIILLSTEYGNRRNKISSIIQPPTGATEPYTQNPYDEEENPLISTPSESEKPEINSDYKGLELKGFPVNKDNSKYTTQYAYDTLADSTVGVICYEEGKNDITDDTQPASQGTGIIISADGYIVTNAHVINNSRQYTVEIITNDATKYFANIVGYDTRTDLAVLKITGKNLKAADFGDSSKIQIGQDVIAIGNPGGMDFQNSLTKGIVSAINRSVSSSSSVQYIQTDTAINPGNSGGPLCNLYGQVIGINTVKIVSTHYEGMGFSIPSNTVKTIVDDIIKYGYVSGRVKIGILGTEITSALASQYNLPKGILIQEITKDSPISNTNVKKGDIITEFDGEEITSFQEVYAILDKHKSGDKIDITVCRVSESSKNKDTYFSVTITLVADEGA